jgi:hypothetical protein
MAEKMELEADRARLEQENTELRRELSRVLATAAETRRSLDAAQADRNGWRARADEAAARLRAYRMGDPDPNYQASLVYAAGKAIFSGASSYDVIMDLCVRASIPMPRDSLTRVQAEELLWKCREKETGECTPAGSPARCPGNRTVHSWQIDAVIEASK